MPKASIMGLTWFWAVDLHTFNYDGHAKGKDKQNATDYNQKDKSSNQVWPGVVAGEWHNNHH
jgi:stearoyl-CoA desaturase (delta-9 desaturase)